MANTGESTTTTRSTSPLNKGAKTYRNSKTELLNKLKNRLINEKLEEEYVDKICTCIRKSHVSNDGIKSLLNFKGNLVFDDSTVFNLYPDDNSDLKPSPKCPDTRYNKPGPILKRIPRKPVKLWAPDLVVPGNGGSYKCIKTNNQSDNAHILLSVLKYYLSALIVFFGINGYSLKGQEWLNYDCDGPAMVTGAFTSHAFEENWKKIKKLKIPVIMVMEHYEIGIHIGNMYSYICDNNGNVIGCHVGADAPYWLDRNLDLPRTGNYDGYEVDTLVVFGSQRLVYMYPSEEFNQPKPAIVRKNHTLKAKTILESAEVPLEMDVKADFLLGLEVPEGYFDDDEDYVFDMNHFNRTRDRTAAEEIASMQEPTIKEMFALTLRQKLCCVPWGLVILQFVLSLVLLYVRFNWKNAYTTASHVASLVAMMLTIHWTKIDRLKIKIKNYRIVCFGDYKEDFIKYMNGKYICSVDNLPYGFYKCYDGCIVRTDQTDPTANYSNLIYPVQDFVVNNGHAHIGWKKVFKSLFHWDNMKIGNNSEAAFTPRIPSEISAVASDVPFSITFTEKDGVDAHLWNDQALRDYIIPKHTAEVYYSIGSHRAVPGGYRSTWKQEDHLNLYKEFWIKFIDRHIPWSSVDPWPDLSRYGGRKLRKYLSALAKMGMHSLNAFVCTFIKVEALPYANLFKKPARIISPNTVMFNLFYKNWFHKFEELLLAVEYQGIKLFAKGSTLQVRHETIMKLTKKYRYTVPIDFKGFDYHHKTIAYLAEIFFYEWLGLPRPAGSSLRSCKVSGVISYNRPQRHSGDLFTGSGNCLVVGSLLSTFLDGHEFTFYCDGDDTLLFMNNTDLYYEIEEYLLSAGYEISKEGFIDNRKEYTIPFCQVYYQRNGFHVDIDRNLNKLGNVTASTMEGLAHVIYGKLQALNVYSYMGLQIDMDLKNILNGIEPEGEVRFKLDQIECMRDYQKVEYSKYIPLDGSVGLIGKICLKIKESILLDLYTSIIPQKWNQKLLRRRIIKIIYAELKASREQQVALPHKTARLLHHVEYLVENFGLQSLSQELVDSLLTTPTSQDGSPLFVNSTNRTECTQFVSTGKPDTINSQMATYTCLTTLTNPKNRMTLTIPVCSDNNAQRLQTSQPVATSTSQAQLGSTLLTEDQPQERTPTSSTSSTTFQQTMMPNQSNSQSNTTSHSSRHKFLVTQLSPEEIDMISQEVSNTFGPVLNLNKDTRTGQQQEPITPGKLKKLESKSTVIKFSTKSSPPQMLEKRLITYLSSHGLTPEAHTVSVCSWTTQQQQVMLVTSVLNLETLEPLRSLQACSTFQLLRQEILTQVPQLMYVDSTSIALAVLWSLMTHPLAEDGQLNLAVKLSSHSVVSSPLMLHLDQKSLYMYLPESVTSVVPSMFMKPAQLSTNQLQHYLSTKISITKYIWTADNIPYHIINLPLRTNAIQT